MHNQFKTQKFKHLMLAMGPRDLNSAPYSPVHCSSHSMTSFQSSELTEPPVVENSQLFAQRVHSARYAPLGGLGWDGAIEWLVLVLAYLRGVLASIPVDLQCRDRNYGRMTQYSRLEVSKRAPNERHIVICERAETGMLAVV